MVALLGRQSAMIEVLTSYQPSMVAPLELPVRHDRDIDFL